MNEIEKDYTGFGGWPQREADHILVAAMLRASPFYKEAGR